MKTKSRQKTWDRLIENGRLLNLKLKACLLSLYYVSDDDTKPGEKKNPYFATTDSFVPYNNTTETSWPVGQKKRSADKFDSSDPSYCQFLIKL